MTLCDFQGQVIKDHEDAILFAGMLTLKSLQSPWKGGGSHDVGKPNLPNVGQPRWKGPESMRVRCSASPLVAPRPAVPAWATLCLGSHKRLRTVQLSSSTIPTPQKLEELIRQWP